MSFPKGLYHSTSVSILKWLLYDEFWNRNVSAPMIAVQCPTWHIEDRRVKVFHTFREAIYRFWTQGHPFTVWQKILSENTVITDDTPTLYWQLHDRVVAKNGPLDSRSYLSCVMLAYSEISGTFTKCVSYSSLQMIWHHLKRPCIGSLNYFVLVFTCASSGG